MNPANFTMVEGNLLRESDYRKTYGGTPICTFSIATDRFFTKDGKTEKEASFFDIEAWGELAEIAREFGDKGRFCRVTGRLKQERWDAPTGGHRSRVVIVALYLEFRPKARSDNEELTGGEPAGKNKQE
jgi:single-strand DNA-binding protein